MIKENQNIKVNNNIKEKGPVPDKDKDNGASSVIQAFNQQMWVSEVNDDIEKAEVIQNMIVFPVNNVDTMKWKLKAKVQSVPTSITNNNWIAATCDRGTQKEICS